MRNVFIGLIAFIACTAINPAFALFGNSAPEKYLVPLKSYTSAGHRIHREFHKQLLALAATLADEKQYKVRENCIGYYYDRREAAYYLGIDLIMKLGNSADELTYGDMALFHIKSNLKDLLDVLYRHRSLLGKKTIAGTVITLHWEYRNKTESVSVWTSAGDIYKLNNNKLTLAEVMDRSTITNAKGAVIRFR